MTNITIKGSTYTYSSSELQEALAADGVFKTVAQVIGEIEENGLGAYPKYSQFFKSTTGEIDKPKNTGVFSSDLTSKLNSLNILEVLYALQKAAQELRGAAREMRHAERDSAAVEAGMAAEKIRSAAVTNAVVNIISGGVNAAMGAVSIGSSISQFRSVKSATADLDMAKQEVVAIKADTKLAESQLKLQQTPNDAKLQAEVKANASEAAKLNAGRTSSLESDVKLKKAEISSLENEIQTAEKNIANFKEVQPSKAEAGKNVQPQIENADTRLPRMENHLSRMKQQLSNAENALPNLENRLAEAKSMSSIYENPTAPSSLEGAQARLDSSTGRINGTMERQTLAQQAYEIALNTSNTTTTRMQGVTTGVSGVATAAQGVFGTVAAYDQAEAAYYQAESQNASSLESETADFQKAAEELMANVKNIVKETLQAYNQANSSIYRNM